MLIQASSRTIPNCFSSAIVEVMALREAAKWIIHLQLSHVVLETDCKAVVYAFHSHIIYQFDFGCLVKDCKTFFFFLNTNLSIRFIKRQASRVAHIVALMLALLIGLRLLLSL